MSHITILALVGAIQILNVKEQELVHHIIGVKETQIVKLKV